METQRVLELGTKYKRKLADEFLELCHDDLKSSKFLKVAEGEKSPLFDSASQLPASEGNIRSFSVQQDALNLERSGVPVRFLYYDKGQWRDFPEDLLSSIVESFVARKTSARFATGEKVYVLNFVYMIQLNLRTGFARSIAWIDRSGKRFSPSKCVEQSYAGLLVRLLDGRNRMVVVSDAKPRSPDTHLATCQVDTRRCDSTTSCSDFASLGDRLIKVADDEQDYGFARDKFLSGFSLFGKDATITGIYRNSHTGMCGQARFQAFNIQEGVTTMARGDANVRYAWHGTSKDGIVGIIRHGFGQPRVPKNGDAFGVGVYLAPEDSSHVSALYSDVDENGEQHIVLCKVIMGKMEQVFAGSQQFHPSSEDFDTGVDDMQRPKRYIIWSTHMNTHILPLFVISFRLSTIAREIIIAVQRGKQTFRESSTLVRHSKRNDQAVFDIGISTPSCYPRTSQLGEFFQPAEHPLCGTRADSCTNDVSNVGDVKEESPCPPCLNEGTAPTQRAKESACTNVPSHHNVPRSPWISFPELFPLLESKLEPQEMNVLHKLHAKFQVGRLPRSVFVKMMRRILGDEFLRDCIKKKPVQAVSTCGTHSFCG